MSMQMISIGDGQRARQHPLEKVGKSNLNGLPQRVGQATFLVHLVVQVVQFRRGRQQRLQLTGPICLSTSNAFGNERQGPAVCALGRRPEWNVTVRSRTGFGTLTFLFSFFFWFFRFYFVAFIWNRARQEENVAVDSNVDWQAQPVKGIFIHIFYDLLLIFENEEREREKTRPSGIQLLRFVESVNKTRAHESQMELRAWENAPLTWLFDAVQFHVQSVKQVELCRRSKEGNDVALSISSLSSATFQT